MRIGKGSRLYISGPIGPAEGANRTANENGFRRAARVLREMEMHPVNPLQVLPSHCNCAISGVVRNHPDKHAYECYLRNDFIAMLTCRAVVMLPGWEFSPGARKEKLIAEWAGLPVLLLAAVAQRPELLRAEPGVPPIPGMLV